MTGWLTGKVALVTGAASGIGEAVVVRFLQEGARVCALDADGGGLRRAAEHWSGEAVAVEGDVRRVEDNAGAVRTTVQTFGRLDVFVGNAGIFDGFVRLLDLPADRLPPAFAEIFAVNVLGYLLGARTAAPEVVKSEGSMIFTVSSAGHYAGAGGTLYTVSKHAVVGLIRQLAHELAPKVRVNGVAPGGTLTGMRVASSLNPLAAPPTEAERQERIRAGNPLGIVMQPDDHAAAYVFLASDRARAITGAVIPSDGGLAARGLWAQAGGMDL